jgi:hypothetical protein
MKEITILVLDADGAVQNVAAIHEGINPGNVFGERWAYAEDYADYEIGDSLLDIKMRKEVRRQRDEMLNTIDIVHCNALNVEEMTEKEKAAWREYKQALRDVPQQEGFPLDVVFPTMPSTKRGDYQNDA